MRIICAAFNDRENSVGEYERSAYSDGMSIYRTAVKAIKSTTTQDVRRVLRFICHPERSRGISCFCFVCHPERSEGSLAVAFKSKGFFDSAPSGLRSE
jgi:hypothetical protein